MTYVRLLPPAPPATVKRPPPSTPTVRRQSTVVRPTILLDAFTQSRDIIGQARDCLLSANKPPFLFLRGNTAVRLVKREDRLVQELVTRDSLEGILLDYITWERDKGQVTIAATPPREVLTYLHTNPDPRLPSLNGIVSAPVLVPPGRLLLAEGYDRASRILYHPDPMLRSLGPLKVTAESVARARALLLDDLLGDFPFASRSDKAHAVALVVTPWVRFSVDGPVPVILINSPAPGTGKTLLAACASVIFLGDDCPVTTLPGDETEMCRKLTAILLQGRLIVILDNATSVDSGNLAAAITATRWSDRLITRTQELDIPNLVSWIMTGNNVATSVELSRRSVPIRLDAQAERPWDRGGFRHPKLRQWVKQNRLQLIQAVLTLIENWIGSGRRPGSSTLGGFESWSDCIGGILECADIPGFLEDRERFYDSAAPERTAWRGFVAKWHLSIREPASTSALLDLALKNDLVPQALGSGNRQSQLTRLGKALQQQVGCIYDGFVVSQQFDSHRKMHLYQLEEIPR
jgi:putative DNA primase/helicase